MANHQGTKTPRRTNKGQAGETHYGSTTRRTTTSMVRIDKRTRHMLEADINLFARNVCALFNSQDSYE
jgi:hypothetical protein